MARQKKRTGLSPDPDEARQQIISAAEDVILRYGVAKTTMDDIGKEAGVSRPTVYRYFADRDSLLAALIERRSRLLFERARAFILQQESFDDQLVEGFVYLVDQGRKDPIVRILVGPEHTELSTAIFGGSDLAVNLTAEMWEPVLRQAMDKGEMRADHDMARIAQWLTLLQFILVGRLAFVGPAELSHRKLLREFVLPAFLPVDASVPRSDLTAVPASAVGKTLGAGK